MILPAEKKIKSGFKAFLTFITDFYTCLIEVGVLEKPGEKKADEPGVMSIDPTAAYQKM